MGKDEAVQFPCCPCGGGVYIALLRQLALLQKEKKKKRKEESLRGGRLSYLMPYYLHLSEEAL